MSEFKNYRKISSYMHASGLPRAKDIKFLKETYGLEIVYDLTKRERSAIKNICNKLGIKYNKIAIDENNPDYIQIKNFINSIPSNKIILIFCFRGIHRTGVIINLLENIPININNFKSHKKLLKCLDLKI